MWTTIDRARRRLTGVLASADSPELDLAMDETDPTDQTDVTDAAATPVRPTEDVVIILGSFQLDQLRAALEQQLGDAVERPDTPARIEHALSIFLAQREAPGKAQVLRRPAGLSTPESWEIHLDGVDRATSRAVRSAGRTGIFAS